jgi:hypothetical protein
MSLGPPLAALSETLQIDCVPGAMVFADGSQVVAIDPGSKRQIVVDELSHDDAERVVSELLRLGVLRQENHARTWKSVPGDGVEWVVTPSVAEALAAIEESVPVAFVTGGDALYLPAEQPEINDLLLERFLSTLSDPLPRYFLAVVSGDMELVFCRPTEGILGLLAAGLPSTHGAACYRPPAAWESDAGTPLTGRLRPAINITVTAHGALKVASARSAPRLSSVSSPAMFGGAVSVSTEDAELRAVAEAYERHVAGIVPRDLVFRACGGEREDCISPDRFVKYNEEQHSRFLDLYPYRPDEPRVWAKAMFATGEPCAVLAPFSAPFEG